jgi:hypothetical protein
MMNRFVASTLSLVVLIGCQLPPEQVALKPLPEDGTPIPYVDLTNRTRAQVDAAREAFYEDNWTTLEESGKILQQTSRLLVKTTDVPARHKDTIAVEAGDVNKEATKLRDAAKAKDVKASNESLQQLHLLVRQLSVSK